MVCDNNRALVLIMAWRRPGDKPLSEPMMGKFGAHICVSRPQWEVARREQSEESREQPYMTTSQPYMFFSISPSELYSNMLDWLFWFNCWSSWRKEHVNFYFQSSLLVYLYFIKRLWTSFLNVKKQKYFLSVFNASTGRVICFPETPPP